MYRRRQPARRLPADITATGLEMRTVQGNRAYRFASQRAQRTSDKYGAQTTELLAVKPTQETSK